MKFRVVPLTRPQANELVAKLHRHHKPVHGHRFAIGLEVDGATVGCAIVGRPVSSNTEQYRVAEVTRMATDGTKNACSFLYSACARIAREMGFDRIQTFILDTEPGVTLRAAGWTYEHTTPGGHWNGRKGRRNDQPQCPKQLWSRDLR